MEENEDIKAGRYRHFKGNDYLVLFTAFDSRDVQKLVIYKALYGEGKIWARPLSEWNETVERDGKTYKRFVFLGD